MMNLHQWQSTSKKNFRYAEDPYVQLLELPYEDNKASMVVLLPREKSSLEELRRELSSEQIAHWESQLAPCRHPLNLKLPKWKLSKDYSLIEPLQKMGMLQPFSNANFSRMIDRSNIAISDVIHKAFIEVSEKGTEAAAATAIVVQECSVSVERKV
jgi:serpin B